MLFLLLHSSCTTGQSLMVCGCLSPCTFTRAIKAPAHWSTKMGTFSLSIVIPKGQTNTILCVEYLCPVRNPLISNNDGGLSLSNNRPWRSGSFPEAPSFCCESESLKTQTAVTWEGYQQRSLEYPDNPHSTIWLPAGSS